MSNPPPPSQGLVTTGSNSLQSINWNPFNMGNSLIQIPLNSVRCWAASRVQPHTVMVGQQFCKQFRLGVKGRENVNSAVKSLKMVGSRGDVLHFGLGVKDLVRTMVETAEGTTCLALCAALQDFYTDEVAVEVLLEMARMCDIDGQWMPSNREWRKLVDACAGALSTSDFPNIIEKSPILQNHNQKQAGSLRRAAAQCSNPKSIADALFSLARVSSGALQGVTIKGGPDVGWLAAIAEWLLDLKVSIIMDGGGGYGEVQYTNETQVLIVFEDLDPRQNASQDVQLLGKTVLLQNIADVFDVYDLSEEKAMIFYRVSWRKALSSVFSTEFTTLMQHPKPLGGVLGSAAVLFEIITLGRTSVSGKAQQELAHITSCSTPSEQSYGTAFVDNLIGWFPELSPVKKHTSVRFDYATAQQTYSRCIEGLRNICACDLCQKTKKLSKSKPGRVPVHHSCDVQGRFCLVIISETIINLGRLLANVTLECATLNPLRRGIELAYERHWERRQFVSKSQQGHWTKHFGEFAYCLRFDYDRKERQQDSRITWTDNMEKRLRMVLELFAKDSYFAGSHDFDVAKSRYVALTAHGICVFSGILLDPLSCGDTVGRVHILPGRIHFENKSYRSLIDRNTTAHTPTDFDTLVNLTKLHRPSLRLSVRESATALLCRFELHEDRPNGKVYASIAPTRLANLLAYGTYTTGHHICEIPKDRFQGSKRRCKNIFEALGNINEPTGEVKLGGNTVSWIGTNQLENVVAVLATATRSSTWSIRVVRGECVHCAIQPDIKHPLESKILIVRIGSPVDAPAAVDGPPIVGNPAPADPAVPVDTPADAPAAVDGPAIAGDPAFVDPAVPVDMPADVDAPGEPIAIGVAG